MEELKNKAIKLCDTRYKKGMAIRIIKEMGDSKLTYEMIILNIESGKWN